MKFYNLILCLVVSSSILGQGDVDLFRYSKTETFGSARFTAMGGAFGALGADLSSSQINPAGFGRYSSSQFNISLGANTTYNKLLFKGTTTDSRSFMLKPNSVGVVFVQDDSKRESGYQYIQFGLGYNRIQDFTNSFTYKGYQYESLLESFAASAEGVPWQDLYITHPFTSSLAYETYTINPVSGTNNYEAALYNNGDQYHERTVDTKGGIGEYYVSLSGNFMNGLYVGANLGLRTIKYEETINHHEDVTDTTNNDLRSFDYMYNLATKGSGANLKIGVIYLPVNNIRLGFSIHTPTFYNLTDDTKGDMTATFKDQIRNVGDSLKPIGNYKYRLRTPTKIIASAAYIFGTRGCISADLEYINYKWANLRSTTDLQNYQKYDFTIENAEAKKVLQSAINLRVGGELVFNSSLFVRAGFGFSTNAYNNTIEVENGWDKFISGGLGYKWGQSSIDLSVRQNYMSRNYYAFQGSYAEQTIRRVSVVFGFNYTLF